MAKLDDFVKGGTPLGIVIGIGATVVAATFIPILPALARVARPTVRAVIKSGIVLTARAQELIAETNEQLEDIFAEARDELIKESEIELAEESAERHGQAAHSEDA